MSSGDEELLAEAAARFNVENMRDHQLEVCQQYLKGRDSFFIAPTGKWMGCCSKHNRPTEFLFLVSVTKPAPNPNAKKFSIYLLK